MAKHMPANTHEALRSEHSRRAVACIFADGVTRWVRTTEDAIDITRAWKAAHLAMDHRQWLSGYVMVDLTEEAFARIFGDASAGADGEGA